jgi:hypothetical protein
MKSMMEENIQGLFHQAGGPEPEVNCRGCRSGRRGSYRSISGDDGRGGVNARERDAPHDDD